MRIKETPHIVSFTQLKAVSPQQASRQVFMRAHRRKELCLWVCDEMCARWLSFLVLERQCVWSHNDMRSNLSSLTFHVPFKNDFLFLRLTLIL